MNHPDTEILFPSRVIPELATIRGQEWQALVAFVQSDRSTLLDELALVYTVVKTAGCVSCNSDSFRAMRGCTQCSLQAMRRSRCSDTDFVELFEECRSELERYLHKNGLAEVYDLSKPSF